MSCQIVILNESSWKNEKCKIVNLFYTLKAIVKFCNPDILASKESPDLFRSFIRLYLYTYVVL